MMENWNKYENTFVYIVCKYLKQNVEIVNAELKLHLVLKDQTNRKETITYINCLYLKLNLEKRKENAKLKLQLWLKIDIKSKKHDLFPIEPYNFSLFWTLKNLFYICFSEIISN